MKKSLYIAVLILISVTSDLHPQQTTPDSANLILKKAMAEAHKSKKNIFIIYHASWCKWCHHLDSILTQPEINKLLENNYVMARLDVKERGEKIKTNENPGAFETLVRYGGEKSGIPFMAFLDRNGKFLANSNVLPDGQNFGCPGTDEEIDVFIKLLRKTGTRFSKKQLNAIASLMKKKDEKQRQDEN
jgi:uncharacterized protein YyaL (SSP411 family)